MFNSVFCYRGISYGGEDKSSAKGYYIENQQIDVMSDIFHFAVNLSWILTLILSMLFWVVVQFIFALLYLIDKDGISGLDTTQPFVSTFFLSVQTFSTVGYGIIFPNSKIACTVMIFEILVSVCFTSLFSGIIFYKFSKPASVIKFSEVICCEISELEYPTLVFRFAHLEHRALFNMRLQLSFYEFAPLSIEFQRRGIRAQVVNLADFFVPYFAEAHEFRYVIDQQSPIRKYLHREEKANQWRLKANISSLILTLEGIGSVLKSKVQAHKTYTIENVRFNHTFEDLIHLRPEPLGPIVYINQLSKTKQCDEDTVEL